MQFHVSAAAADCNFLCKVQATHDFIIKRMSDGGNDCQLINATMLKKLLRDSVDGSLLIQKWVKVRGPCAAIYRTTWKRSSAPSTVLVTGQKVPCAPETNEGTFTAVPGKDSESTINILPFRGGGAIVTSRIVAEIVDFVEHGNSRFVLVSASFILQNNLEHTV